VYEFQPGDRVAAFHEMVKPGGSFAEYALAWDHTTFRIPESLSFEEASTIPLAAMTSAISVFQDLRVPQPWSELAPIRAKEGAKQKLPILIYGASSATGAFGAQLARLSGLKPIIGVVGRNQDPSILKLYDYTVDYRKGEDAVVKGIEDALEKEGLPKKVKYAFDAISENLSYKAIRRVLDKDGYATVLLATASSKGPTASADEFEYFDGQTLIRTSVGQAFNESKDFAFVWFRFIARAVEEGRFKGHPYEVVPGGLGGISKGLQDLAEGKASGIKYVFRIAESS
jgi:NADPH2:quinone reductase